MNIGERSIVEALDKFEKGQAMEGDDILSLRLHEVWEEMAWRRGKGKTCRVVWEEEGSWERRVLRRHTGELRSYIVRGRLQGAEHQDYLPLLLRLAEKAIV